VVAVGSVAAGALGDLDAVAEREDEAEAFKRVHGSTSTSAQREVIVPF